MAEILERTRQVLDRSERFDARRSQRRFVIGTPDAVSGVLLPKLLAAMRSEAPGIDLGVIEGDRFRLGAAEAAILETPGHTSGHISFWFADAKALFCADTLFSLGCGRVIEGTMAEIWGSLDRLRGLPGETKVYCGHEYTRANARFALTVDPDNRDLKSRAAEADAEVKAGRLTLPVTIAAERRANPFLRPEDKAIRRHLGLADAADADVFAELRRRKNAF